MLVFEGLETLAFFADQYAVETWVDVDGGEVCGGEGTEEVCEGGFYGVDLGCVFTVDFKDEGGVFGHDVPGNCEVDSLGRQFGEKILSFGIAIDVPCVCHVVCKRR